MSYSKTNIIQLRERNAQGKTDNPINGSYEVNINPALEVSDSDVLSLKSAFIDSVDSSSGKVIISEDEEDISLQFYHYILNWDTSNKTYNKGEATTTAQPDGKHYFLCDTKDDASNTRIINTITIHEAPNYGVRYWGDIVLYFEYVPPTQTTATPKSYYPLKVPKIYKGDSKTFTDINIQFNNNYPFKINTDKTGSGKKIEGSHVDIERTTTTNSPVDDGSVRTAHQFNLDIKIDRGSYDPDELCRIITDKITALNRGNNQYLTGFSMDNDLMTTSAQFNSKNPQPSNEVFYASEDGKDFYLYTTGEYLSGTSQFGLEYDEGLNKFKIEIMNNPYYEDSQIAIKGVEAGNGSGNFFIANKNSGIVLSGLQPYSLWFNKLGFSQDILVHPTSNTSDIGALQNQTLPVFTGTKTDSFNPIEEGINMTGSYKGLDVVINKTNTPSGDPNAQQMLTLENISATSLTQNQIFSETGINDITYDYGYYMLEIDMGINQNIRGKDFNNKKIQSIIGRYYSNNSFTSAYNEGSIPYIHRGKTVYLNKFVVRILKDDGTLADDIGDNNTLFIEHTKSVNNPSIPALPVPLSEFDDIQKALKNKND